MRKVYCDVCNNEVKNAVREINIWVREYGLNLKISLGNMVDICKPCAQKVINQMIDELVERRLIDKVKANEDLLKLDDNVSYVLW